MRKGIPVGGSGQSWGGPGRAGEEQFFKKRPRREEASVENDHLDRRRKEERKKTGLPSEDPGSKKVRRASRPEPKEGERKWGSRRIAPPGQHITEREPGGCSELEKTQCLPG